MHLTPSIWSALAKHILPGFEGHRLSCEAGMVDYGGHVKMVEILHDFIRAETDGISELCTINICSNMAMANCL